MTASQCFAFNKDGLRCSLDGGHSSKHQVVIEFDDDEIFNPQIIASKPDLSTPAAVYPAPPQHLTSVPDLDPITGSPVGAMCIICDHPMHKGMCPVGDEKLGCDCRNGVSSL